MIYGGGFDLMSKGYLANFNGDWFEQRRKASGEFYKRWHSLELRMTCNQKGVGRFSTHRNSRTWVATLDAMDDLAKADQLEQQSNNFIIKGEI